MKEIAILFTRLGFLGFGGPIAVISMLEEEVCRKRGWLSRERFTELLAVCKLLPGPISTQLSIAIASERAGARAGALAGVLFIAPAFLLVLALSWVYVHSGIVQKSTTLFAGMQAGALAVILGSVVQLAKPHCRIPRAWMIAVFSGTIVALRPSAEPWIILGAGLLGVAAARGFTRSPIALPAISFLTLSLGLGLSALPSGAFAESGSGITASSLVETLANLAWVCFKAGAFTFGSGLAIVPTLEADAVGNHRWLTHSQFMDGLAIGQVTPGPVVITATFIGYNAAGWLGAVVATAAMFAPSFFNVLVLIPHAWKRVAGTPAAKGFSAWAVPAVIGAISGAGIRLGWITLGSPTLLGLFAGASLVALFTRIPAWALIPAAGMVSFLVQGP